jgi:isoamyl acetate esterase
MKNIVLIGDSICMGYQETVRTALQGRAEVQTPEENGGNSRNVLAHLDAWVISRAPDIVHINCGLHDLRKEFGSAVPAVPLDEYERNVARILDRLTTESRAAVIWAATTPVNEQWHHARKGFDRFEADVVAFNAVAAALARQASVPINDLFAVVQTGGRDRMLLPDGVHFTPEAYVTLGRAVADCLAVRLG